MSSLRCALPLLALAAPAAAQWSSDPTQNLVVADAPSDQNQPKLIATADGGAWVSWFGGQSSGWDVRVQRLGGDGVARFVQGGLLVADRNFSSTQDYGLALALNEDALLAYRDNRAGITEVVAARIDAAGAAVWGAGGVVLTNNVGFVASPKITGTADGGAVVAWTENSTVRLQRLSPLGAPLWGSGALLTPPAGSYSLADLHAVGDDVIVSFVHQTGGFTSPRHLKTQRFDATGATMWGASPLAVFDGGSLQIGNFPAFRVDAAGAALFYWYSSSPSLQSYVQRLDPAGTELFPHNGVPVATTAGRVRVDPDAGYDPATGDVYVAWREQNATQSQRGVSAQRIDATGARAWGDDGLVVTPLAGGDQGLVRLAVGGANGGALVVWSSIPAFGTDVLGAVHVARQGVIDVPRVDVASTPSAKARLALANARLGAGGALLAWSDARNDGGDILAQNVGFDGTLGAAPTVGTEYCGPAVVNSSGAAARMFATGSPVAQADDLVLHAEQLAPNAFSYFLASRTAGFVANPGGSQGNLCLAGAIGRRVGGQILASGPAGQVSIRADLTALPQPNGSVPALAGETWRFQCWFRDAVQGAATSNFSTGLEVLFL